MGRSEAKSTTGGGALCTSVISGRRESWRKANCAMKIRKCDGKNRFTHKFTRQLITRSRNQTRTPNRPSPTKKKSSKRKAIKEKW